MDEMRIEGLAITEIAERLGAVRESANGKQGEFPRSRVHDFIESGRLPATRLVIGKKTILFVKAADLEVFIETDYLPRIKKFPKGGGGAVVRRKTRPGPKPKGAVPLVKKEIE